MTDDNIIGIDGRQAVERKDQAEREKREEILRHKLKCEGLELRPGMAPGTYTIARPPEPPRIPLQILTSVRIHGSAAADCEP
jgi:hypothetical protein